MNFRDISLAVSAGPRAEADECERISLTPYIGPARVIDAREVGGVITPDAVAADLACMPSRILFRTRVAGAAGQGAFASLHPETLELLAAKGALLVGVDAPSIDLEPSPTRPARRAAGKADIRILEGLLLDGVPAGDYELIALPLARLGSGASPVRAILRDLAWGAREGPREIRQ